MVTAVSTQPRNSCFLLKPVYWVIDKIQAVARLIFGYLARIVTFQLGAMKVPGAFTIMRIYQHLTSDPREERPYDPARLLQSKNFLMQFGGKEAIVHPTDGQAQIHCMTFKAADFLAAFARLGAQKIPVMYEGKVRNALMDVPVDIAKKFYLPIVDIRLADGTLHTGALLPQAPQGPLPHILHSHSPGRSMCMDRKFLGMHLGAGYDVTIWDPRGTAESTGTPSEGGYYLDADAVFQHVLGQVGGRHNHIFVSGFCKGAACAAYLKARYHHLGVHFIASNPYTSMKEVCEGYGWFGKLGARFGLSAIQDPTLNVPQDFFDNVNKFRNLPRSEGKFVIMHTDTDKTVPVGSAQKIIAAIGNAGPVFDILSIHPNRKANGHNQPPYERDWENYISHLHLNSATTSPWRIAAQGA